MASSISSKQYIEPKVLVIKLCEINDKIMQQVGDPSFEQFAPMYHSYLDGMKKTQELNTSELLKKNGIEFREAIANCCATCEAIKKNTIIIFDKFVKIIETD